MKTFEERFTAWADGQLQGEELAKFEIELAGNATAAEDKASAQRLGGLLRENAGAPELTNADFFNHQLMERISGDAHQPVASTRRTFWSIPAMAWAGAFSLLIAFALFRFMVPGGQELRNPSQQQVAEVIDVRTSDPAITATAIERNSVAVVWLEGLEYIPDTYALK